MLFPVRSPSPSSVVCMNGSYEACMYIQLRLRPGQRRLNRSRRCTDERWQRC
jgi:hypothetical protein